jgi:DNA invertase Pin-like site-specific DNA recombinase
MSVSMEASDAVRAIGYVRVSKSEGYHTGAGVAAQRAAIVAACRDRDWELIDIVEDIGFSGRSLQRPGIRAVLSRLERGEGECLVVGRLDRLSRSLLDFAGLSDRARLGGWGLITLDLMVDTTTPAGEALANVLATFAQFERRMIGQRIRESNAQLRAQSRVYSGYTPLGFRREEQVLVRDRAQQRVVAKARAMYARSGSLSRVAAWLNSQGLLSAAGKPWRGPTVKRMFRINDVIGCPTDQIPPEAPATWITWMVPFGYRMEAGELVADRAEQASVRRMQTLRKRGFSFRQIAELLTADGVPTKRNAPAWSDTSVNAVLNGRGALRATARARNGEPAATPAGPRPPRITPAPYGYRAKVNKLVPHQAEQAVIRRMRRMRRAGAGYREIATRLDGDGVPPPRSVKWHRGTVRHILLDGGLVRGRLRPPPPPG